MNVNIGGKKEKKEMMKRVRGNVDRISKSRKEEVTCLIEKKK